MIWSAPSILNVIQLAKDFYSEGVSVLPTTVGTGPMHTVFEAFAGTDGSLELAVPIAVIMGATKM